MFKSFLWCNGIIILVMFKVLLYGMFKGFCGYGSVWYGSAVNNSKVGGCSNSGDISKVIVVDRLVFGCGYKVAGLGIERTPSHALP